MPAQAHANIRLLKGRTPDTDSGGRKVEPPPPFVRKAPDPPGWMPREAKAEWRRVVPELERLRLLKNASRSSLTAYCMCWQRFYDANKLLAGGPEKLLHRNSQGVTRHPAVTVAAEASKELRAWCGEFGLTPSAEGRLSPPESGDDDGDLLN